MSQGSQQRTSSGERRGAGFGPDCFNRPTRPLNRRREVKIPWSIRGRLSLPGRETRRSKQDRAGSTGLGWKRVIRMRRDCGSSLGSWW